MAKTPIGIICTDDSIRKQLHLTGDFIATLTGLGDIRTLYRLLRFVSASLSRLSQLDSQLRYRLLEFQVADPFTQRPQLSFLNTIDLGSSSDGYPAAALFNRLANSFNNSDDIYQLDDGTAISAPYALNYASKACAALAAIETGREIPGALLSRESIEFIHTELSSPSVSDLLKRSVFMKLGRDLLKTDLHGAKLLRVALARKDLERGKAPSSILRPHEASSGSSNTRSLLVLDVAEPQRRNKLRDDEQALLSTQTSMLAGAAMCTPFACTVTEGGLFGKLRQLNEALQLHSPKAPALFRRYQEELTNALPPNALRHLTANDDFVLLLSDLPLEWLLVEGTSLCLSRAVSRVPLSNNRWSITSAILEGRHALTLDPQRVLILELLSETDPLRHFSKLFKDYSDTHLGKYTYRSPKNREQLIGILQDLKPEIVVLDGHGKWDKTTDELKLEIGGSHVEIHDLLDGAGVVPPVWLLSSCQTSVAGAVNGCLARKLLAHGALCVLATLNPIDAWFALRIVSDILGAIYSKNALKENRNLAQVIFHTRQSASILLEKLVPLFHQANSYPQMRKPFETLLRDWDVWEAQAICLNFGEYRSQGQIKLKELLTTHGLMTAYQNLGDSGRVMPAALLYTAFGVPLRVTF